MIKGHVARAMQVSYLTEPQLRALQEREKMRGYAIPNWNIQDLFHIDSIKDKYGIPNDDEAQLKHQTRVEKEMWDHKMFMVEDRESTELEYIHQLDWNVFHKKDLVNWDYQGRSRRGKKLSEEFEEEKVPF